MRLTVFAATLALLLWGTPAFAGTAPDQDGDGISNGLDNCSLGANPFQDDTDADDCGNVCDADYLNSGKADLDGFAEFVVAFNSTQEEKCHFELGFPIPTGPIAGNCIVDVGDFGFFVGAFNKPAGPSGTTAGTTACPTVP